MTQPAVAAPFTVKPPNDLVVRRATRVTVFELEGVTHYSFHNTVTGCSTVVTVMTEAAEEAAQRPEPLDPMLPEVMQRSVTKIEVVPTQQDRDDYLAEVRKLTADDPYREVRLVPVEDMGGAE